MANSSGGGGYRRKSSGSRKAKAKKQRIPKRGPGVAELEKILREQEHKRMVALYGSNGNVSSQLGCGNVGANGRSKGVYIGGSGVFLPEQTLLPISWSSSSSGKTWKQEEAPKMGGGLSFPVLASNGSAPPPPPLLQKNHHSMMDLFPLSATTTTPPSSSAGVYHNIEPPSSQKPSLFPEEDKIMGTERPGPSFPMETWRPAPPRMPFQPIRPQVSWLDPLSSSSSNGVFNFEISRDPMPLPTSPLELKVSDQGNPSGYSSRQTTIQNCQPDLSKFNKQFPFQENTKEPLQQRSSSSSDVPVYNRGFFSLLLQPEDLQRGSTSAEPPHCLKTEICCAETTGEFIDLNLKL